MHSIVNKLPTLPFYTKPKFVGNEFWGGRVETEIASSKRLPTKISIKDKGKTIEIEKEINGKRVFYCTMYKALGEKRIVEIYKNLG